MLKIKRQRTLETLYSNSKLAIWADQKRVLRDDLILRSMVTNIIIINDKGSFNIHILVIFFIAWRQHVECICVYNIFRNMQRK